jgi:hypothetical protein
MHRRSREQKFQNYVSAIGGFVELARLMVERPELHGLYEDSPEELTKTYEQLSPEERAKVLYCDTIIALCETVWRATQERRLPHDEWAFWQRWARGLNGSPYFRWTLRKFVEGEYIPSFLAALVADPNTRTPQTQHPNHNRAMV